MLHLRSATISDLQDASSLRVLHRSAIYRLNSWLKKHPGGELALLHFVGRDATDEIEAYHTSEVVARMRPFMIGRVSDAEWDGEEGGSGWRPIMPPIEVGLWPVPPLPTDDGNDSGYSSGDSQRELSKGSPRAPLPPSTRTRPQLQGRHGQSRPRLPGAPDRSSLTLTERLRLLEPPAPSPEVLQSGFDVTMARQHHLSLSYRRLHQKVQAQGYYRAPQPFYGYGPDLARLSLLFAAFFALSPFWPVFKAFLRFSSSAADEIVGMSVWRHFFSAVFLGLWWHQLAFVAHDAGHSGVSGKWWLDRLLGIFIADFLGGLSIGWWCDVSAASSHFLSGNRD